MFKDAASATAYGRRLHLDQQKYGSNGQGNNTPAAGKSSAESGVAGFDWNAFPKAP
jgi:hypothetical protein